MSKKKTPWKRNEILMKNLLKYYVTSHVSIVVTSHPKFVPSLAKGGDSPWDKKKRVMQESIIFNKMFQVTRD